MSTKDTLTAGLNEAVAKYNALNLDNYVKAAQESVAANRQAETDYINSTYDTLNSDTQAQYDKALTDAKASYDSEYQKNAVQKIINEKKIAETNANLGLTDSGLNRTQQTAAQLSYANQKGKIDLARQNALDNLTLNLNAALAESDAGRSSALLTANEKWDNQAYSLGQTNYNNDLTAYNSQINSYAEQLSGIEQAEIEAAAEVQKAAISTSAKTEDNEIVLYKWGGATEHDDSGVTLLKFTGSNGKSFSIVAGKNPYTNTKNAEISKVVNGKCIIDKQWQEENKDSGNAIVRSCALYGVFSNGYQPKGVCYYDENGNVVEVGSLTPTTRKEYMNGNLQTVWHAENTDTYWIWDGSINEYLLYEF